MRQRRFDLNLLHAFEVVASLGSLTRAADSLHRSQSAVSEQIRKLEDFCQLKLFERGKKGTQLTTAGERLLTHARRMLLQSDIALGDMQGVGLEGDLRIAITDYFRPSSIAGLLKRLSEQFPLLRLHVSVKKSALIESEAERNFDVGVSMRILQRGAATESRFTRRIPLRKEKLKWIQGNDWVLKEHNPLPLVALPATCSLQSFVLWRLDEARVPYYIAHSASGVGGLRSAVEAGLGIACLNASAVPSESVAIEEARLGLPELPAVEFSLLVSREMMAEKPAGFAEQLAATFA